MRLIDADTAAQYMPFNEAYVAAHFLNGVPTADAKPVIHAEWLGIDYDGYADGQPVIELWECSNCGYEHEGDNTTLTNYCPNCGAKMESEEKA